MNTVAAPVAMKVTVATSERIESRESPQTPWPDAQAMGGPWRLAIAVTVYFVICVLAVWIFRREAPRIAEEL